VSPDSFFFFSLPTSDEKTTKLHLHAEKLTKTVLHLNLGHFLGFCFLFFVFFYAKKATEANRKRGPGAREKVRSKRINIEGNTHAQEINVRQLPV
jgi:hypothetical protein